MTITWYKEINNQNDAVYGSANNKPTPITGGSKW